MTDTLRHVRPDGFVITCERSCDGQIVYFTIGGERDDIIRGHADSSGRSRWRTVPGKHMMFEGLEGALVLYEVFSQVNAMAAELLKPAPSA